MRGSGVYAIARAIWTDPDFAAEPYTQREAWMWLLGMAAFQPVRLRGNTGKPVDLDRAEFSIALRYMADEWQWSKSAAERFVATLEKRDMIRDVSRDGFQVYSINKYNDFQVVGLPKRDAKRDGNRNDAGTAAGQKRDKIEALKHSTIEIPLSGKPDGAPARASDYSGDFEEFWKACNVARYCQNAKKPDAFKAWQQTAGKRPPLADLLKLLAAYHAWLGEQTRKQRREYPAQHPATWLRGEVWANYQAAQAGQIDDMTAKAKWNGKAAPLVDEIGAVKFAAWFGDSTFEQIKPRAVAITVPKSFQRNYIQNAWGTVLERIFGQCEIKAAT